jgi:hypothetical protein
MTRYGDNEQAQNVAKEPIVGVLCKGGGFGSLLQQRKLRRVASSMQRQALRESRIWPLDSPTS